MKPIRILSFSASMALIVGGALINELTVIGFGLIAISFTITDLRIDFTQKDIEDLREEIRS